MQTVASNWNETEAVATKWYVRLFPSLADIAFLLPIVALFAKMNGTQLLFADGDTGWHILTGEWILSHRSVPTTDLFSYTKSNQTWFAWEWLWDVVFALVHRFAGLAGVGFITCVMLGVFAFLVYRLCVRVSQNHLVSMLVTVLVTIVSSIHWLARPHLVTWIFSVVFLDFLCSAKAKSKTSIYWLPMLMVIWVNLHGGFVAGLMIVACYAIGSSLRVIVEQPSGDRSTLWQAAWTESSSYWRTLLLCSLATFLNPYGWRLHQHIFEYLTNSELLDKIQEFQSISFHAGPALAFEALLLLAAFVVFRKVKTHRFELVILLCLWAHLALVSARNIPIFALVSAPFIAEFLADAISASEKSRRGGSMVEFLTEITRDLRTMERVPRWHLLSAASLLIVAGLFGLGKAPFAAEFNPESFPVKAMPIIAEHPSARVFTTDQWADYLLYRFYPAQRSFFDGRSDFYGNDFVQLNQKVNSAEHNWMATLQRYHVRLVVLKPDAPLSEALKLTGGSRVLFDDGKTIVFDISGTYRGLSSGAFRRYDATGAGPASTQIGSREKPALPIVSCTPLKHRKEKPMISSALLKFWKEEDGQDLVEYSLLLAFIALAAVGLLSGTRSTISGLWSTINSTLASASTTAS